MLLALQDGTRVEPTPSAKAECPACGGTVTAKCGQVVTWHWAHVGQQEDCDRWAEPVTGWHREWQQTVPVERREVVIGRHRADIITATRRVVEIQHSSLPAPEIREREAFYGDMAWIFDARDAYEWRRLDLRFPDTKRLDYCTFRWKQPRKSLAVCRRPVLLDLGLGKVLRIGRLYASTPCGGWGKLYTRAEIIRYLNAGPRSLSTGRVVRDMA